MPNTLNIYFPRASSRIFQECLADQGFSVAAGASASKGCASHVLLAMGCSPERASQSLRFSLGHPTTPEDVDCLLEHLPAALEAARCETPVETG